MNLSNTVVSSTEAAMVLGIDGPMPELGVVNQVHGQIDIVEVPLGTPAAAA